MNSKWDDEKMQAVLLDKKRLEAESFSVRRCIFELEGRKINPYHLIDQMEYAECNGAIKRIAPKIEGAMPEIEKLVSEIPVLSDVQKRFYLTLMENRYEKVLKPTYQKIKG